MKKIALIILFINLSWMLTLTPYVNSNYHSDSDLYPYKDTDLFYIGIGAKLNFHTEYVNLESDISYNFFDCLNERPNDFNPNQGFGALENNEGLSSNQFNYFFTSMKINYNKSNFDFYVALDNPTWGPGVNKIVLSDKAPPFFNNVTGLSVFDLRVKHGVPKTVHSSCKPPLSVIITLASMFNLSISLYPIGFNIKILLDEYISFNILMVFSCFNVLG